MIFPKRLSMLLLIGVLGGCAHPCEEQDARIAQQLLDASLVLEGADACDFGSAAEVAGFENVAHNKLYQGGESWQVAKAYIDNFEGREWAEVACFSELGETANDDVQINKCFMKGRQIARMHVYDFNGAILDLDLLQQTQTLGGGD
ncbi:MAG: hypothetical protein AAF513_08970 [Pseudomonadota bacterium]